MAVSFCLVGAEQRAERIDATAASFVDFAMGIVRAKACAFTRVAGVTHVPGARRAVAQHTNGRQLLIASSGCADLHPEHALLDLMKRCRWGDFKYMYVEVEPCHGGAFARPRGSGCKDRIAAALPASAGIVFYSHAQPDRR
jgi:hypothetical protein